MEVWRKVNLWQKLEPRFQHADGFNDLFFEACQRLPLADIEQFCMQAWSLWKRRNLQYWEGQVESVEQVVCRANEVYRAWCSARNKPPRDSPHVQDEIVTWKPPPTGYLKCNIDAAVFSLSNQVGAAACVRDQAGLFVQAASFKCSASMLPAEAEAWGLLQSLSWLKSTNLSNIMVEMDCKQVVDDVLNAKLDLSEYGSIIKTCRNLLLSCNNFKVVFSKRLANGSAHALAKASINHANRTIFDHIPACIWTIIMNEIS